MSPTRFDPIDPYAKWLGIPEGGRPPDYYVLLGLDRFESDPDTIRQAADERTKIVRPRCMKHRELGTQILNEIAKARVCLTDPDRKAAYDGTLKQAATRPPETTGIRRMTAAEAIRRIAEPGFRVALGAMESPAVSVRLRCELQGHKRSVSCVVFDPQGLLLASAGHDGTTRIWNLNSGQLRATLDDSVCLESRRRSQGRIGKTLITSAAFSPDGAFFATAGEDTTAKLWDVTKGQLRQVLRKTVEATGLAVTAIAFQPSAPVLAVGFKQRRVQVWNVNEGRFLRNVACATKDLAFSPDGLTLVTSRCFWDFDTGEPKYRFAQDQGSANCLLFSPDGSFVVTGTATGVHFWTATTGALETTLRNRQATVKSVAFSSDASILAAGLPDGTVEIWDVSKRRFVFALKAHMGAVQSVAFSPDDSVLATGGTDAQVKLWQMHAAP